MSRVIYWLFVLSLPLLFTGGMVCLLVNNERVYEYSFDKYQVEEITGMDRAQLGQVATRLIEYLNCRVETPQMAVTKNGKAIALFHDYELIHLRDVKRLIQLNYIVQGVALTYIIIYALIFVLRKKGRWQDLARAVIRGSIATLGLMALLGILSIFNFEWLFIQFHRLAFHNPYWMLDPNQDYLIMLFPSGFWQDIAAIWAGMVGAVALLSGGIAWAVIFIYERHISR